MERGGVIMVRICVRGGGLSYECIEDMNIGPEGGGSEFSDVNGVLWV